MPPPEGPGPRRLTLDSKGRRGGSSFSAIPAQQALPKYIHGAIGHTEVDQGIALSQLPGNGQKGLALTLKHDTFTLGSALDEIIHRCTSLRHGHRSFLNRIIVNRARRRARFFPFAGMPQDRYNQASAAPYCAI